MPGAEALALALLAITLAFAALRPRDLPELPVPGPAAVIVVAVGAVSASQARCEISDLAPTVGFLAAVLVLGELCEREGLFAAAAGAVARGSRGRPVALLALVFALAAGVTAVLSLDTTVVLLTPVVFATAARLRPKPHVYACVHLANAASLLLPVSNLSNLLAFHEAGIPFARFAALMALPWLCVIGVEWLAFRRFFAADLVGLGRPLEAPAPRVPRFAAAVLTLTLAGFALSSTVAVDPAWIAGAGAAALAARSLVAGRASAAEMAGAAAPGFLLFVLALGVVVKAAQQNGLGDLVHSLAPSGASLGALLGAAALGAVLANLVNNLPAILILLPAAAAAGTGPVLATLVGVNVGPNLTYVGSLATLLWRRSLHGHGAQPDAGEFLRLGAITVPLGLLVATVALWLSLKAIG